MRASPRARTRRSQLRVASSVNIMFIRNYFRPSNGLPEPTDSLNGALKGREQGTSSQSCARSAEYIRGSLEYFSKNSFHGVYSLRAFFSVLHLLASPYVHVPPESGFLFIYFYFFLFFIFL